MARRSAARRGDSRVPLERDDITSYLEASMVAVGGHNREGFARPDARLPLLSESEALAVAGLLEELQGVYREELMGWLARSLPYQLHSRRGP